MKFWAQNFGGLMELATSLWKSIRLIKSLLKGRNKSIPNVHREFFECLLLWNFPESFSQIFMLIFEFSENFSKLINNSRKIIFHNFVKKHALLFSSISEWLSIQFWAYRTNVFTVVRQLNLAGGMALFSRQSTNQTVRKQTGELPCKLLLNHVVSLVFLNFTYNHYKNVVYFSEYWTLTMTRITFCHWIITQDFSMGKA